MEFVVVFNCCSKNSNFNIYSIWKLLNRTGYAVLCIICLVQIDPSIKSLHKPLYLSAVMGQRQWK